MRDIRGFGTHPLFTTMNDNVEGSIMATKYIHNVVFIIAN